jgi:MFS family permease
MTENDQSPAAGDRRPDAATRVRYAVLAVGCSLALLAYVHRQSYVRGQTEIATDLRLNNTQRGYLAAAFLVAYGLFQVPCGLLGDRLGARHLLTVLMLGSSMLTGATALAAYFPKGPWQFPFLFGVRFLTATTLTNAAKQPSDLPGNSSLFRDRHQTTNKCRRDRRRKLIRFSARCSACRILIRFGGMRAQAARAHKAP